jgi:hypothetical protein
MTMCLACRRGRPRAPGETFGLGLGSSRAPDATAALLIRVWEDDGLRARLMGVRDPSAAPTPWATAHGVDGICDAVRAWLVETFSGGAPRD